MDIEGAEYEVLFSTECSCLARCKYLIIELHEHEKISKSDLINRIEELGLKQVAVNASHIKDVLLFKNQAL